MNKPEIIIGMRETYLSGVGLKVTGLMPHWCGLPGIYANPSQWCTV